MKKKRKLSLFFEKKVQDFKIIASIYKGDKKKVVI